jgi:two-component system chemotaxis response regulator CheB
MIVIGGAAGAVEALIEITQGLPRDLPAAVFVVPHLPPDALSVLPELLNRRGSLPAIHPRDGQLIERGYLYVALPDLHLLVESDTVHLAHGPKENGRRPAIDPLFRSAALSHGRQTVGVILSGTLDDGAFGLWYVKQQGGVAIVQEPGDAFFPELPRNAIAATPVDHILPASAIPPVLTRLAYEPVQAAAPSESSSAAASESELPGLSIAALRRGERPRQPSLFSCPECGGALREVNVDRHARFHCRVGHTFSLESLTAEHSSALETRLWSALRGLEEKAALSRRLVGLARDRGQALTAARFEKQERAVLEQAEFVRRAIQTSKPFAIAELDETRQVVDKIEPVERPDQPGSG